MKSEESERTFRAGFNCAQAVFVPFARECGIDEAEGYRIASAFGAGMGRMQETCGAVTGAFMAIGAKHGFAKADDQRRKDLVLAEVKKLAARFRGEFGTLLCKDLLGCDLNTEEGQRLHREKNQREEICLRCVKFASSMVEGG